MSGTTRRGALGLGAALLAAPALGQSLWPTGPIRFIVTFPAGGSTDLLSRIWCNRMAEITGQPFVVENRSGSGGNVGTEAIARAAPDGNTIGLASVASLAIAPTLYRRLPFDVTRDFSYICGLWQLPNLLITRLDFPADNLPDLIRQARENPGRFTFASSGAGTTLHLSGELFKQMAGVDILHIPYRGGAPAQVDLLGGRVDMMFGNIPEAVRAFREGKVKALGVTGPQRSPQAPQIPAIGEFLPGYAVTSWGGVCGPAGIAPGIVARMAELGRQAVESTEVRRRYEEAAAEVWWKSPADLAQFRRANEESFAALIRAAGAVVE